MDRRQFLKNASAAAAALSLPWGTGLITPKISRADFDDPRVAIVRDSAAHQGSQINIEIAQVMMDEAIRRYTGIGDLDEAYRSLFPGITASSVIGIKVNCINSYLSTHPLAVQTLTNGLQKMRFGSTYFPANNIIVYDRTNWELTGAGYTLNTGSTGVRIFGTNEVGYSNIYLNCNGSNQHPSRIITDYCDYLVSFGILKNHSFGGVTFSMKNHFGSIQYPGYMHGNNCDPYVPAVNQQIRDVLSIQETLFIVDGIFGCYYGGPAGPPNLIYDGFILGEDRVAVDAVCRDILDDAGCTTLGISHHIDTAAGPPYNLGTANLAIIQRIEVDDPSIPVETLEITESYPNVELSWTSPEYTGSFKVLRSLDPTFETYDEIALTGETNYIDLNALSAQLKYFYRIVKSWG